jgi:N6-L-threonylcarbamoyladenine synthase
MLMLGIETSCDETSVALVDRAGVVHANLIASQIERHRPYGGVVPEIASREHLRHLMPLVRDALGSGGVSMGDLHAVAVTAGPGLVGALLVGVAAAQGLAYGLGIPIVPVNHLEGHIFSPYLQTGGGALPVPRRFLSLVVSGGHSSVYDVREDERVAVTMINRTRDDAAGELFDKVGKFVGLPYPAGPHVERTAETGDAERYRFPLARFKDGSADFSFSGLKATAIRLARQEGLEGAALRSDLSGDAAQRLADFCASLQKAIGEQIADRLGRIWEIVGEQSDRPEEISLAGGVAANGPLRDRVSRWAGERGIGVRLPERIYCTDNAAMIAFAGWKRWKNGMVGDPLRVPVRSRLQVGLA